MRENYKNLYAYKSKSKCKIKILSGKEAVKIYWYFLFLKLAQNNGVLQLMCRKGIMVRREKRIDAVLGRKNRLGDLLE
jgi:hypothetical protein